MDSFAEKEIAEIREKVETRQGALRSLAALDSSVVAAPWQRKAATCVRGPLDHSVRTRVTRVEDLAARVSTTQSVRVFREILRKARWRDRPRDSVRSSVRNSSEVRKRKRKKIGAVTSLAQGTIYADIESGLGKSAVIESHHNVGGLPDHVDLREIIEPLRMLFKDEVRAPRARPSQTIWLTVSHSQDRLASNHRRKLRRLR